MTIWYILFSFCFFFIYLHDLEEDPWSQPTLISSSASFLYTPSFYSPSPYCVQKIHFEHLWMDNSSMCGIVSHNIRPLEFLAVSTKRQMTTSNAPTLSQIVPGVALYLVRSHWPRSKEPTKCVLQKFFISICSRHKYSPISMYVIKVEAL